MLFCFFNTTFYINVIIFLLDVNECALTNGPCQQNQCYNTRGSYQCLPSSCPQQYHQVGGGYVTEVVPSFLERASSDDSPISNGCCGSCVRLISTVAFLAKQVNSRKF